MPSTLWNLPFAIYLKHQVQRVRVPRSAQKMVNPQNPGPRSQAGKIDGRYENNRNLRGSREFSQLRSEYHPVHHRHNDIGEDNLGYRIPYNLLGNCAVVGFPDLAAFVQQLFNQ